MLERNEIIRIASEVAIANLTPQVVRTVSTEPTTDSEGRDALRITIVIAPDTAAKLKGDAVLDTLVQIHDRLQKAGEERFPLVDYSTEEELEHSGDS